jgi:mannose-6-phosphate isomerase-like protein (cupin superfamily)
LVKPIRRIVAGEDERGTAVAFSDGPSPDVRLDPARPGFAATRIWVTETTPAKVRGIRETLHLPHTIEPPRNGSVCRVIEFPPEDGYRRSITDADVRQYFAAMGSPDASTLSKNSPHPYMQRTETLDFCYIQEGEITLVLDTEEVHVKAGDSVVLRGANHAWSNRSSKPCIVIFSHHDASDGG